jgi:hypothetical protein
MLLVYVALIGWMLVVAIVISDTTLASLKDIKGEWLPATLCFGAGLGAGLVFSGVRVVGRNDAVRALFQAAGFIDIVATRDLAGIPRVVAGRMPERSAT